MFPEAFRDDFKPPNLLINLFSLLVQIDFANATFELSQQNLFRLQSVLSPPEASVLSE